MCVISVANERERERESKKTRRSGRTLHATATFGRLKQNELRSESRVFVWTESSRQVVFHAYWRANTTCTHMLCARSPYIFFSPCSMLRNSTVNHTAKQNKTTGESISVRSWKFLICFENCIICVLSPACCLINYPYRSTSQ